MTTSVKVSVPASAKWDAAVGILDKVFGPDGWTGEFRSEERTVRPGEVYEVHITDTRSVSVREIAHTVQA